MKINDGESPGGFTCVERCSRGNGCSLRVVGGAGRVQTGNRLSVHSGGDRPHGRVEKIEKWCGKRNWRGNCLWEEGEEAV